MIPYLETLYKINDSDTLSYGYNNYQHMASLISTTSTFLILKQNPDITSFDLPQQFNTIAFLIIRILNLNDNIPSKIILKY